MFSSVPMLQTRAVPFLYGNETLYDCKEIWTEHDGKCYTIIVFVVTFGLPISALIYVYLTIGLHILRMTAPGNPDIVRDNVQWNLKVKVCLKIKCFLSIYHQKKIIIFCLTLSSNNPKKGNQNVSDHRDFVYSLLATTARAQLCGVVLPPKVEHDKCLHDICHVILCLPLAINGA